MYRRKLEDSTYYSAFIRLEADDAIPLVSSAGGGALYLNLPLIFASVQMRTFVVGNIFLESDGVDGFYVRNCVDGRLGVRKGSTIRCSMLFIFHTDDP